MPKLNKFYVNLYVATNNAQKPQFIAPKGEKNPILPQKKKKSKKKSKKNQKKSTKRRKTKKKNLPLHPQTNTNTGVAELVDALDLGSSALGVGVRVPSSVHYFFVLPNRYSFCTIKENIYFFVH